MTNVKTIPSQAETLAKLYLESKPAEISNEAIAQLCDWLMDAFHQLPLNLQFADYMRYANVEEMFADIEQGHLWVSAESYDSSVYPNPIYGFIFQRVHDYDHFLTCCGGQCCSAGRLTAHPDPDRSRVAKTE